MESCEMTKILVMFTSPGTSGVVFTGLCFQLLRVHVYRAQNWCLKPWNHENSVICLQFRRIGFGVFCV